MLSNKEDMCIIHKYILYTVISKTVRNMELHSKCTLINVFTHQIKLKKLH